MKFKRKSVVGLLLAMGLVFAGIGFVYAQTATDADFDGDGIVGVEDFLLFIAKFGTSQGDGKYEAKYDLDGDGQVGVSDFLVFVGFFGQKAGPNLPPVALAGEDQSVDKRETITLDGSNSSDPEGRPLSFTWRQIEGTQVALSDPEIARPTFSTLDPGNYAFELVVHDGATASVPDTVVVEIVSIADVAVKVGSPDAAFMYKETTGNQMTFALQGTAPPVQVGEVMVNTVEPYFLKKVTQVVSQDANELVVETEDAALTDVIETASIRRTFRFPATKLALASPTATGPITTLHTDASATLRVTTCDISFSPEYEIKADIDGFKLKSFKAGIKGDLVATLGMGLEAQQAFSQNAEKDVAVKTFTTLFWIGPVPVPVIVRAAFGVGATFSAEVAGSITAGITLTKPVEIGTEYKGGAWQEQTGGAEGTYQALGPTVDIRGAAAIRGYVRGQLDVKVLGVAGPYFGVKPYFGFVAKTNQEKKQIDWTLHAGADGYVGVKATLFDKIDVAERVADKSWDFNLFMALLKEGFIPLDEIEMVWIEPGTFQMGTPLSQGVPFSENERPVHEVTISQGFYIGKYEVTQGQWERVMGTRPWQGEVYVRSGSSYPAVYVSWEDAQEFIRRLNASLNSDVYRLPTEAEWEYVCRAGTTTRWSFGDDESQLGHYAWYYDNAWDVGERYGHSVGTKRANPWGLYDMHGNVWEWVQDWYGSTYYRSSPSVDPAGPSSGSHRVLRGGAFGHGAQNVRSAARHRHSPSAHYGGFGFRLLRQVP